MNNDYPPLSVRVEGDHACFTRPEMKAERVSYPVMTPTAATGILSAIFWKPEFTWVIKEIRVLEPIQYFSMVRNEVSSKAAPQTVNSARMGNSVLEFYADDDRQQRHTLGLRDVAYEIYARVQLAPHARDVNPAKYRDQFRRRVQKGRCFHRPYLGCREFSAYFGPVRDDDEPIPVTRDIGRMLHSIDYESDEGRGTPRFFEAKLVDGVLDVPPLKEVMQ